jgi:hypothetical protein
MADSVRYLMEEMVPELEEFVKQRYFSREEVRAIVKRRQEFEYALKRPSALKEDYLRCVVAGTPAGDGWGRSEQWGFARNGSSGRPPMSVVPVLTAAAATPTITATNRYIEYESNLEALRRHRRQALLLEQQAGECNSCGDGRGAANCILA